MTVVTTRANAPTNEVLYHRLFDEAERARWRMTDIPFDQIDERRVDDGLIAIVRAAVLAELTTYTATQRFMAAYFDDVDFSQWIAIWFYEETKHPHAMALWLRRLGVEISPEEALAGRATAPFADAGTMTLALNVIAELNAAELYLTLSRFSPEPVLTGITRSIAADEARHASHFFSYTRKRLEQDPPDAREKRRLLALVTMATDRARTQHPGQVLTRDLVGSDAAMTALLQLLSHFDPEGLNRRICLAFADLLDLPDLKSRDDLRPLMRSLRTEARSGGR